MPLKERVQTPSTNGHSCLANVVNAVASYKAPKPIPSLGYPKFQDSLGEKRIWRSLILHAPSLPYPYKATFTFHKHNTYRQGGRQCQGTDQFTSLPRARIDNHDTRVPSQLVLTSCRNFHASTKRSCFWHRDLFQGQHPIYISPPSRHKLILATSTAAHVTVTILPTAGGVSTTMETRPKHSLESGRQR